jgi:hypothetical protein
MSDIHDVMDVTMDDLSPEQHSNPMFSDIQKNILPP